MDGVPSCDSRQKAGCCKSDQDSRNQKSHIVTASGLVNARMKWRGCYLPEPLHIPTKKNYYHNKIKSIDFYVPAALIIAAA